MSVLVRCPECSAAVRVARERLERRRRCAECGLTYRPADQKAPDAGADSPPEAPPARERRAARPKRRKPAPRSNGPLLVGLLAVGFLMLAGCGVGGFFVFRAVQAPNEPAPEVAEIRPPAPVAHTDPVSHAEPLPPQAAPPPAQPQPYVLTPYVPNRPEPAPVVPEPVAPTPVPPRPVTSGPVELKMEPWLGGSKPQAPVPPKKPAAPKPVPAVPPELREGEAVDLGGPLRAMYASGGRHLVFQLNAPHRLVVYDVAARKAVSTIDVADQNVHVAVGRDKVFVGRWHDGRITRYDLRTGKSEATVTPDELERLIHLAVATEGGGPLVTGAHRGALYQVRMYDPETLAPLTVPIDGAGAKDEHREFPFSHPLGAAHIAASADGAGISLGARYYTRTPAGYKTAAVNPSSALRPIPDGSALVGNSLWTADGRIVPFASREARWMIPAAAGPFFLALEYGAGHEPRLMLHAGADPKPLGALPTGPVFAAWVQKDSGLAAVSSHQHVAFLPEPGLLVLAPAQGTEARFVPVDLPALLTKAGRELTFTSVPPVAVPRDRKYAYQATAITRTGARPAFKLESGPPGMTVSESGALAWTPDTGFDGKTADVRLAAQTADGKSVVQRFTLILGPK